MKNMKFKEWIEKKKTLNDKYDTVDELIEHCDKTFGKHYGTIFLALNKMLMVRPVLIEGDEHIHISRDSVLYRKKDGKWHLIDTKKLVDVLVEHLKDHVSVEKLVEDALYDTSPEELDELFERVVKKKGSIREEEGCYKLVIGGKRGQPMEFMLRD